MSGKTQFEGRTAEEAVARARKALGDSDALRCWKTRKGGVGGFFAREVYVASLTPPPGSEATRGKGSRTSSRLTTDGSARSVSDGSARSVDAGAAPRRSRTGPGIRRTTFRGWSKPRPIELSLQSLAIPAGAFDQVLAEAEAALARLPEVGDTDGTDHPRLPSGNGEDQGADDELEDEGSGCPPEGARPLDGVEAAPPPGRERCTDHGQGEGGGEGEAQGPTEGARSPVWCACCAYRARAQNSSAAPPRSEARAALSRRAPGVSAAGATSLAWISSPT